jgi:imidazolonepropionase-like protein
MHEFNGSASDRASFARRAAETVPGRSPAFLSLGSGLAASWEPMDLLIKGGPVVTMDSGDRVVDGGAVAIRGDTIIAVGTRAQLMNRYAPTGLSVVPVEVTDFDASI